MKKANFCFLKGLTFLQFRFFLLLVLVSSQLTPVRAERRMFSLTGGEESVQLSIKIIDHLVVVSAQLNGKTPVNFILDTGTPTILLTDPSLSRKFSSGQDKEITFAGPGKGAFAIKATILTNQTLSLPGVEGKGLAMVATKHPLPFIKKIGNLPIHGILGYPFFTQFAVTIDYAQRLLILTEPLHFTSDDQGQAYSFSLHQSKPVLQTSLTINHTPLASRLMVDTGASHSLLLNSGFSGSRLLPNSTRTKLGEGFGGAIYGRKGTIPTLKLADLQLHNVQASLPEKGQYNASGFLDRDGSIGGGLLHNFVVTINYQTQTLYLKKNPEKLDAPQPILVQKKSGKRELQKGLKLAIACPKNSLSPEKEKLVAKPNISF